MKYEKTDFHPIFCRGERYGLTARLKIGKERTEK